MRDDQEVMSNAETLFSVASTTPQEAIQNIEGGRRHEITSSGYGEMKEFFSDPNKTVPKNISRSVAQYVADDTEKASLVKPDAEKLSYADREFSIFDNRIKGKDLSREMSYLAFEMATGNKLSREERLRYKILKRLSQENESEKEKHGFGFVASLPAEIAAGVYDMGRSWWNIKDLAIQAAGQGMVIGAGAGAVGGPAGAGVGAAGGAATGFAIGTTAGMMYDEYRQSTGQVYSAIEDLKDLDESTKRSIAHGAGVVMGALSFFGEATLFKGGPWLKKLFMNPKNVAKKIATEGGESSFRKALKEVGVAVASEAGEESSQEAVQIISENLAKKFSDNPNMSNSEAFIQSLYDSATDLKNYQRVAESGIIGGLTGGAVGVGLRGAKGTVKAALPKPKVQVEEDFTQPIDTEKYKGAPVDKGTAATNFKIMFDKLIYNTKNTEMNKIAPKELDAIRQGIGEDHNTPHVWIDQESLTAFANNEEKSARVQELLSDSDTVNTSVNAPIRIETGKAARLAEDFPEFSEHIRHAPDALSVNQMKEEVKTRKAYEEKFSDFENQNVVLRENLKNILGSYQKSNETEKRNLAEKWVRGEGIGSVVDFRNVHNVEKRLNDFINELENRILNETEVIKNARLKYQKSLSAKANVQMMSRDFSYIKNQFELKKEYDELQKEFPKFNFPKNPLDGINKLLEYLTDEQNNDHLAYQKTLSDFEKQKTIKEVKPVLFNQEIDAQLDDKEKAKLTKNKEKIDAELAEGLKEVGTMSEVRTIEEVKEEVDQKSIDMLRESNETNVRTLEDYLASERIVTDLTEEQQRRKDEGKPAYAIDPKSLSKDQKKKFFGNKNLVKRNVFAKEGGMPAQEVAAAYGFGDATEFLNVISGTLTRNEQIAKNTVEAQKIVEENLNYKSEFENSKLGKAYDKATKFILKQMAVIKEKGVNRPKINFSEISTWAKDRIGTTKISLLNADQWKVGQQRSEIKANQALAANDYNGAYREKEKSARNAQLAKESHVAIGKVNRAKKFIAQLGTGDVQSLIKDAGKMYQDALNYLLDVYGLDPAMKGKGDVEAYDKFVKKMYDDGKGDFSISPEAQSWIQDNAGEDLTVDQYLYLVDKVREVVNQGTLENELLGNYEDRGVRLTQELYEEVGHAELIKHPDYDENKSVEAVGVAPFKRTSDWIRGTSSYFTNIQFITQQLDQGVKGGFWSKLIHQALEGTGYHKDSGYGRAEEAKILAENARLLKAAIKQYGKGFNSLGATRVDVVEFAGIKKLNEGKLTKLHLLRILMNMGNAENKSRVANWGISAERMMEILPRYLEKRDYDFVQDYVWQRYKDFRPKIGALEKLTKGIEFEFVQPESFEAFGRVYEGGYFPIKYSEEIALQAIGEEYDQFMQITKQGQKVHIGESPAFEGIVRSPHTKQRVNSTTWSLDIENDTMAMGFEEVAHDLAYRVPVRDIIQMIKNKTIAKDMKSVLGYKKYDTLLNSVAELSRSAAIGNSRLYIKLQRDLGKAITHVEQAFYIDALALNINSWFMNFMSLTEAIGQMGTLYGTKNVIKVGGKTILLGAENVAKIIGSTAASTSSVVLSNLGLPSFSRQMGLAALKISSSLNHLDRFMQFAEEIDPTIFEIKEDVEKHGGVVRLMPKNRLVANKLYNGVMEAKEATNRALMNITLQNVDYYIKAIVVHAAYNHFMAGEAYGHSIESVMAMPEDEREKAARGYANQMSASVTMRSHMGDKSVFQKAEIVRLFSNFLNELRNKFNNRLNTVRMIGYDSKKAAAKAKAGDYAGAQSAFLDAGSKAATMIILGLVGKAAVQALKGQNATGTPEDEDTNLPEYLKYHLGTASGAKDLAVELFTSNAPILREMTYAEYHGKEVSVPIMKTLTNVAHTVSVANRELLDAMGLTDVATEMSDNEFRQMLSAISVLTGGFPSQAVGLLNKEEVKETVGGLVGAVINKAEELQKKYVKEETREERIQRKIKERMGAEPPPRTELETTVDQFTAIARSMNVDPSTDTPAVAKFLAIVKGAESSRDWKAVSESGAFGIYQFLPSTWNDVINTAEGRMLGLKPNDMYRRDPKYQEAGMRILIKHNVENLRRDKVPLTTESLYFAHHFGPARAKEIFKVKDTAKLRKDFFIQKDGTDERKTNPKLHKVKTVGDMKRYLRSAIERGIRDYKRSSNP